RFSCEYMDDELGLIYYNYWHLNPHDGRWLSRDPIMEQGGWNLFAFVNNNGIVFSDKKGENYNPFTPGMMNPPSTYNSPVYTPFLKDTSDTDISITYSAICQNMGIWDWIVNKLLSDKITKTPPILIRIRNVVLTNVLKN
ncbi:RHS repeat-associated core domain-containing protein, partial [uncultured Akkermansia sp.]